MLKHLTRRMFLGAAGAAAAQTKPPNIIFILADDLGWTGVRCFGHRHARTPNLDRLASQGVRFTSAYVAPQCTPTRASLLTGQHTARNRMWHVIPRYGLKYARLKEPGYLENLPRGTPTVAAALRSAGYTTGIIGKWHLTVNEDGKYEQLFPEAAPHYGFDWAAPRNKPPGIQARTDKGVDQFTTQAIEFIEQHRRQPFFLYLAHHSIHRPVIAPPETVSKYREMGYHLEGQYSAHYMAALEHMDASIGRLLARLEELQLASNTVVMFLSDNGGVDTEFDNSPLRSGKGSAYEGGIRVPCIVRWPGVVRPGSVRDVPIHVIDWYPTLLDIAGGKVPEGHKLDGISLTPLLRGAAKLNRHTLYWYMPLYDIQWGATPSAVIRKGDYKLIEFFGDYVDVDHDFEWTIGPRIELYNLRTDIGERNNLAPKMPKLAAQLRRELNSWIDSTGAPRPTLNPDYDPTRPYKR